MRLDQVGLPGDILRVKLTGALDIAGAGEIDVPFSTISGKNNKVIVDFADVTFLASIGIRLLVKAARDIGKRNGRLVVFGPTADARKVLRSTGIDSIITVVADETAAIAACA
ncbi:STAS domain-containing protein [Hyphomicrobium sp. 99]|uniref:STAS domain-containing protein n=1 Tax=Hyphomicrobium sp. 99 TaxID=1163419 RepID=UPI0005F789E6|nr:STAS domain-containing protein [Hyphomicrobium sp. 99]